jgi:hypothetical protein
VDQDDAHGLHLFMESVIHRLHIGCLDTLTQHKPTPLRVLAPIGVVPSLALRRLEKSTINPATTSCRRRPHATAGGKAHAVDPAKRWSQCGCAFVHAVCKVPLGLL